MFFFKGWDVVNKIYEFKEQWEVLFEPSEFFQKYK